MSQPTNGTTDHSLADITDSQLMQDEDDSKDDILENNDAADESDPDDQGDESEDDEETEEEDEDEDDESESEQESQATLNTMPRSPNSTPTCYICLNEFDGQDIGSPDSCENIHYFCHECIEEWSKQVNTCPVDRKTFSLILVRRVIGGEIIMKVPVIKESVIENNDAMIDDVTYCEICGRCDREDRLLLCDGCDFGYHCECLTPPLETIPVDEWFCPECFHRLFGDELQQETPRPTTQRRAIARTGAFEIVRNRIIMRRTGNSQSTTQRATTRKTRKRKRKTTRRRKTRRVGKKRTTKGKSSRRRKRTKRSKMSTRRLPSANTTRSRLATRLGIGCKPKTPYALPTMKPPTNVSSISESRYSAGINNLSMFGYELGLHNPRSYDELDEPNTFDLSGEVGLLTIPRNPLRSIGVKPTIKDVEHSSDPFLLENILNSQQILHAPSCDLIVRDGKVLLKTDAKSVRKCPDSSPTSPSGASPSNEAKGTGSSSDTIYKQDSSLSSTAPNLTDAADSNDISFIKPSPVVALPDDKPDIELYSDIESVGDNKDNEEGEDVKSKNFKKENGSDQRTSNGIASEPADKVAQASDVPSSPPPTIPCNSTNGPTTKDEAELPPDPSDEKSSKRRPSIRDLFGGDSEDDEEEDDLKRLVAEKGSINRHYPIKMPILYKNKFLEDKKNLAEVNEVPISKKWIPIYPETDTVKSSGPKWKAVGTTESEKKGSKWDAKEKQTSDLKKKTLVAEIQNNLDRIEDDLMESLKKNLDESSKQEEAMSSDNEDRLVIQADSPASIELIKEVRPPPRPDNDKKVRICRHGRPIHRDKDKDRRHEEDSNRHNSNPSKRFKDEHRPTETSRTIRVVESDLRDDYDLRKSSRTRSHRDEKKEKSSERVYSKVVNCSKNHSRDSRERRHRSRDRSRELSHNRSHDWSRDRSRDRDHYRHREESHTRSSKRYREDSRNDRRSRRHSERNERSMSREGDRQRNGTKGWKSGKRRRRHHRRRHRHRTESSPQQVSPEHHKRRDPSPEHTLSKDSAKPLISTSQTFSVIKPNSKEIYAQGDQIFINVNFGDADLSKNNNGARTEENGNNKTKSEKSNVDILSPQSGISIAKSEASIASPNDTDNSGAEKAKIGKLSNSESLKVLSEEFKFLPRIMQSIEPKSVSVTHPTDSPVYDDDDSFMPTPTQDESQSPIRNHLNNLKKAKLVSSKSSNKLLDIENDFYDPELPLSSSNESDKSDQSPLSLHKEKHQSTLAKLTPAAATQSLGKMNNNKFGDIDLRKIALNFKLPSNLSKLSGHSSKHVNKPSTSSNQLVDPTRDVHDIIDMELESPSPSSSPNDDNLATLSSVKEKWEKLVKEGRLTDPIGKKINNGCDSKRSRIDASRIDEPLSAVDLQIQQKYIKKLNRQERVVEEVKISLKPFYQKKRITKEEYKDILRKCVPKICHSKSGEINPVKISNMVKAYIKRYRYLRKKKA